MAEFGATEFGAAELRMVEPASQLPLRWGGYRSRYLLAVGLLFAGGLAVQAASVYASYFLTLGLAVHVAGWLVLPAKGGRRVVIAVPSAICAAAPLVGSLGSVLVVVCLAGWLWARQRPALAYLVLVFPLLSGIVLEQLFPQYGHGAVVVGVTTAVTVGAAWLARGIGRSITRSGRISSADD